MADNEYHFGLFGCFGDPRLCIMTFCVPCFTIGKNAEGMGEDCLLHGLVSLVGVNFGPVIRWRLRQQRNIKGSMLLDGLVYAFCPCCALIQDAREMGLDDKKLSAYISHQVSGAKRDAEPEGGSIERE